MSIERGSYASSKIVFFDGVCNICNGAVDFIMKRSKSNSVYVTSLQGEFAKSFLNHEQLTKGQDSFIFYNGHEFTFASEAVFQVAGELRGLIPWFIRLFTWLPRRLTDWIYFVIARNRYRFIGRRDNCRIPTKDELSHFLP